MDQKIYDKATEIKTRIAHIESIIVFLKKIYDKHMSSYLTNTNKGCCVSMTETGFVSNPIQTFLNAEDINITLKGFEKEKEILEKAFLDL